MSYEDRHERQKERHRVRMASDPEYAEKRRAYARKHKGKMGRDHWLPKERETKLRLSYGISSAEYEAMLAQQGLRCKICGVQDPGGRAASDGSKRFSVDHCHATGRIRGLLCHNCNHGLGQFKDDPSILERASAYLKGVL